MSWTPHKFNLYIIEMALIIREIMLSIRSGLELLFLNLIDSKEERESDKIATLCGLFKMVQFNAN